MRLSAVFIATCAVAMATIPGYCKDPLHAYDESSDRAEWFKSLKVPGSPTAICCNIADGHAVQAEQRNGVWYAKWQGEWILIPSQIVLKDVSIDEWAYLFTYYGTLRCFVPPNRGM
ncbi:MAG TPA: hypothetical protein VHD37_01685 [Candidatus Paceibacterota bacterium]|nr:hypothetical protein [Candidatus Paceibacterota bacterium]